MDLLEKLAEAKIQDWIRRGRPRPQGITEALDGRTIESTLLGEIIALRQSARAEEDETARRHLLEEARKRETRLFVLLESSGRPLTARAWAARLQSM